MIYAYFIPKLILNNIFSNKKKDFAFQFDHIILRQCGC